MAKWSKALELTTCCLSPLPGLDSWTRACEKVANDDLT